jgi:hypothetical protein
LRFEKQGSEEERQRKEARERARRGGLSSSTEKVRREGRFRKHERFIDFPHFKRSGLHAGKRNPEKLTSEK